MLDRYTITLSQDELTLVLGVEVPHEYEPQYNAAPTKSLPVITSRRAERITFQKWGLMTMWSKNKAMSPKFFNLPLDYVLNKPSHQKKLRSNRCIIPMDGFYLWKTVAKKQQVPHYFSYPDKKVFYVAGIWEETDENVNSFIMITRESTEQIASFQEDMPCILDPGSIKSWLASEDVEELTHLLRKAPNQQFNSHTVSPIIGDIDKNDVSFIKPAPASDQHGNYTLFT